ncbi:MAG: PilZ domain-containing protein, partial [Gammaproteobacteria bacterium]
LSMTDDPSNPSDARRAGEVRRTALKSGRVVYKDGSFDCRIRNISDSGARLEFASPRLLPHTFELHITGMPVRTCSLRWARDNLVGVQFED